MDRYEQLKIIGRGNYGAAHLVVEKATGKHLVVKKVSISEMEEEERKQASQEVGPPCCPVLPRAAPCCAVPPDGRGVGGGAVARVQTSVPVRMPVSPHLCGLLVGVCVCVCVCVCL